MVGGGVLQRGAFKGIEHFHHGRNYRVVLHTLVVVIGLLECGVYLKPQGFGCFAGGAVVWLSGALQGILQGILQGVLAFGSKAPHAAQKSKAAFYGRIVPFQRGFGRRGKHGVEARRVCAVFFNQVLGVNAVVFGFGHSANAVVAYWRACWQAAYGIFQLRANHLACFVVHMLHIVRPEVFNAALVSFARVDVVEHHALREQAFEGFIDLHQPQIAHDFGPEAGVEQVQNGVLNAANVLVHAAVLHPVIGAICHHFFGIACVAIAHVVPRAIDKGVHRVGFAACGLAAARAIHLDEGFACV